jgi:hypothetical protein
VSVYVVEATGEEVSFEYDPGVVPRYSLYPTMSDDVLAVQERATDAGATPVPGVAGSKATVSVVD